MLFVGEKFNNFGTCVDRTCYCNNIEKALRTKKNTKSGLIKRLFCQKLNISFGGRGKTRLLEKTIY
jgi:hypothetical protein